MISRSHGYGDTVNSLLRFLLDVVPGAGVIAEVDDAREAVETVSDGDIESLAEDAIALLRVRDDLGVSARDIEHDGILCAGDLATHLDI